MIQYNKEFLLKRWQTNCQFNLAQKVKRSKIFYKKNDQCAAKYHGIWQIGIRHKFAMESVAVVDSVNAWCVYGV